MPEPSQNWRRYFGHYYMRDPIVHTLKSLADASEMTLRKVLPEGSAMFRVAAPPTPTRFAKPFNRLGALAVARSAMIVMPTRGSARIAAHSVL